ncbi:TonB-dependent siderophore receptor [Nitrospirillum viridazoti]|uniref:TonB-dependent siderophore receptor n=2 Tax=Nitrospirillum TaxID=1543705 RepID=A0A248JN51_9PROT|nr:TonB-dependent siderophore receptor [Nitrospirillum amazonense]ASG20163.1 TonB-dependent siderophore receptor [Nitrospirillum amazonense CBAmc]TWB29559.1 iron complex outermembrane receptor protein [Nitrospirillum amazonense]
MKKCAVSMLALLAAMQAPLRAQATEAMATEAMDAAVDTTASTTDAGQEKALDDIIVSGTQAPSFKAEVVQVGAFRNQSLLDTPLTVAILPRALLDAQGAQGLDDALRNTPGVTQQSTSPLTSNNFVSRGVLMNARTNYRLNGSLPIINLGPIPIENKQRVELLKGVSALYYGISTPSGIVNVVTKRAGSDPVTSFTLNGDNNGSFGSGFDIGREFGDHNEYGARVNGYASRIGTPVNDVDGRRWLMSGAFDWRASERLTFKLDAEYYRREMDEPGGITLPTAVGAKGGNGGTIILPSIPDPSLRFAPLNAPYNTWATNVVGRADYAITDDWSARAEFGVASTRRQRTIANLGGVNLATGSGTVTGTYTPDQEYRNQNLRLEVSGKLDTGPISHELLIGFSRNRQTQEDQHQQSYTAIKQNLYDPVDVAYDTLKFTTTRLLAGSVNIDTGGYVMDMAHLGESWLLIAGARYVDYDTSSAASNYAVQTVTPTAGLVYKLTPKSSLYATYIEGLESAGTAPDGTTNAGSILNPIVSKQVEVGGRMEVAGAMMSLAWFHIDRGLAYTDIHNTYVLNGQAIHQGVEASVQGEVLPDLSIMVSGQYLNALQENTGSIYQDGRRVENTPRWSGSVFAEYHPDFLDGVGLNAGVYYTGDRAADAQNRATLPAYTTLSLGASYKTQVQGNGLTLRVNADNVTNERYWATGGPTLYSGMPATVRFSATLDL